MSKHRRPAKKPTRTSLADVTINDFANSSVCANRPKKSTANVHTVLQRELVEADKNWDEKPEDLDFEFVEQEDDDGSVSYTVQEVVPPAPTTRRRKKTTSNSDETDTNPGNEYPIDIWFLISEYLRPEDVGRFAGICRAAHEVSCTAKFWFRLYRRYYTSLANLPERLQPESLCRKYGIRTSVIRALNFMYKPYVARWKSVEKFEQHPEILKRTQCVLMWHRKDTNQNSIYYFKMKNNKTPNNNNNNTRHKLSDKPDLLTMLDDVFANQDENCRILQVTCKHLIPISPVLGLSLNSARLNLGAELRHYKLQLWFGSEIHSASPEIGGSTFIVLEPVINVKVLDWWHPLYPHSHNMEHLFNQEENFCA